jgi:hypothetical protein
VVHHLAKLIWDRVSKLNFLKLFFKVIFEAQLVKAFLPLKTWVELQNLRIIWTFFICHLTSSIDPLRARAFLNRYFHALLEKRHLFSHIDDVKFNLPTCLVLVK